MTTYELKRLKEEIITGFQENIEDCNKEESLKHGDGEWDHWQSGLKAIQEAPLCKKKMKAVFMKYFDCKDYWADTMYHVANC